jgi:hypothetical protein
MVAISKKLIFGTIRLATAAALLLVMGGTFLLKVFWLAYVYVEHVYTFIVKRLWLQP